MDSYDFLKYLNLSKVDLNLIQLSNVEKLRNNKFLLIFDEVGCGKTLSAIMCILDIIQKKEAEGKKAKILFLVPPRGMTIAGNIIAEFENMTLLTKMENIKLFEKGNKPSNETLKENHVIIVDMADYSLITRKENKGFYEDQNLENLKYDLIILDEAQENMCNSKTQNNNPKNCNLGTPTRLETACYEILTNFHAEKVIFLTATPIKYNLEKDLFNYFYIIAVLLFGVEIVNAYCYIIYLIQNKKLLSKEHEPTRASVCIKLQKVFNINQLLKEKKSEQKQELSKILSDECFWKEIKEKLEDILGKELCNIKDEIFGDKGIISQIYNNDKNISAQQINEIFYKKCASICFKEMASDLIISNMSSTAEISPHSRVPEIWNINNYSRPFYQELAENIKEVINKNENGKKNRVAVFVNTYNEGCALAKALGDCNYKFVMAKFDSCDEKIRNLLVHDNIKCPSINHKDYLITCSTTDENKLPDVLILSSQVGSIGINLPAYNYIINYHIPNNASDMEQRFGRIDRYNSIHSNLHCIYVISDYNLSYYFNFVSAVRKYIENHVINMPTKNILISNSIIENIKGFLDNLKNDEEGLKNRIKEQIKNQMIIVCFNSQDYPNYIKEKESNGKNFEDVLQKSIPKYQKIKETIFNGNCEITEDEVSNSNGYWDDGTSEKYDISEQLNELIGNYNKCQNICDVIESITKDEEKLKKFEEPGTIIYNINNENIIVKIKEIVSKLSKSFNDISPVIKNFAHMAIENLQHSQKNEN